MRICSLVPAATEVLFALGLGELVVGVTHECDWPPEVASRARVTASLVDTDELTAAEIDRAVSGAAANGTPLYAINGDVWARVQADVVIVQETCAVCAVSTDEVEDIVRARGVDAEIVLYSPSTLDGVVDAVLALGARVGAPETASGLADGMRGRLERVEAALAGTGERPRTFVAEWLDPPFAGGHWVPDMVERAHGTDVAGRSGEPSFRMRWADVAGLAPELVVLAPCGYDLDRTLAELDPAELWGQLAGTPAQLDSRVFAVDANGFFSRPGPGLAEGVELLAHLLHPDVVPGPDVPWSRVQL